MRTATSYLLFASAKVIAKKLYFITVTDSWYPKEGGNIEVSSEASQKHSMASVFSGIKSTGGRKLSEIGGRHIVQNRESWIVQGNRTLTAKKGVCTDCAAAAANKFMGFLDTLNYEARVEIISSTTHAFVVVNREGGDDTLRTPDQWGENAFIIDVWYQNQFKPNVIEGACWADDKGHPVTEFIRANAYRLRLEVSMRDVIGSLFD